MDANLKKEAFLEGAPADLQCLATGPETQHTQQGLTLEIPVFVTGVRVKVDCQVGGLNAHKIKAEECMQVRAEQQPVLRVVVLLSPVRADMGSF